MKTATIMMRRITVATTTTTPMMTADVIQQPTLSDLACMHDEMSGNTHSSPSHFSDSLVVLCFMQKYTMMKAVIMLMRRITVATATTTPMMTAVFTPPDHEVPGGDVAELEKHIHLKTRLLCTSTVISKHTTGSPATESCAHNAMIS